MTILNDTGIIKRTLVSNDKYKMRLLDSSSIDEIMELQNEIVNNLSNVQTFANDSRECILNEVFNDKTGKAIGVFLITILAMGSKFILDYHFKVELFNEV